MTTVFGAGSMVGKVVRHVEDPVLIRGQGSFVDDLDIPGVLNVGFVRSPFAHATITGIDVETARSMPGVVAVHSSLDLEVPEFEGFMVLNEALKRPSLAKGTVNFVGDPVVAVLAETRAQTVDAAEFVEIDYDPLPVAIDMEAALAAGAPTQTDKIPSNLALGNRAPDSHDPLAGADVVARVRLENQRLAVVPMEASAIVVIPGDDGNGHDLTVHLACQMQHMTLQAIARLFQLDPARIRVTSPHVGGSFGGKHLSAEGIVAITLAMQYGRPVKWVETRSENMIASPHSRGQVQYAEMGFKRDGTIVGAHYHVVADAGAYGGFGGALADRGTRNTCQGVYMIPKISYDLAATLTNTTPMGAYRGAGRPEAATLVERVMDVAADELGIDPAELRRRNFIPPDAFPFTTQVGVTYDSGDYARALDEALRVADYQGLRAEQAQRRERGDRKQLGIGIALYVDVANGGAPEYASVEVDDEGGITLVSGCSAHGQGHATTFSTITAGEMGVPIESIRFVQSDTAVVPRGNGTGGSRSVQVGATAAFEATKLVVERAKHLAAGLLEAAPEDIVVTPGAGLGVAGVPSATVGWDAVAKAARAEGEPLTGVYDFKMANSTFPFGCHVSVVEVDMETGYVDLLRHIAVDDCGRIISPMLVDGQVHGGLASGIAQALWEGFVYDEDGNPLTSTLAEYAIPSAAELVTYDVAHTETLSPLNSLGAKGIGEGSTTGSTPAVHNAVVDALSHLGVRHVDMPCTPKRVWQAIDDARNGTLPDPWREPPAIFATLPVLGDADEEESFEI